MPTITIATPSFLELLGISMTVLSAALASTETELICGLKTSTSLITSLLAVTPLTPLVFMAKTTAAHYDNIAAAINSDPDVTAASGEAPSYFSAIPTKSSIHPDAAGPSTRPSIALAVNVALRFRVNGRTALPIDISAKTNTFIKAATTTATQGFSLPTKAANGSSATDFSSTSMAKTS
ncbi:hypothetical protein Cpir12675_003553 [Ceratocystis pirilliformis]|uniref:Uncharacterized protein n=1 Tax=Ceratocystis pirilliformis TaxID=259994 RepID=A0ABR3Z327_9PEZI